MKKHTIIFVSIIYLLVACSDQKETKAVEVVALSASEIYQQDSVGKYIEQYKDINKDLAESYIQKATEIENVNLDKAIYFLKRGITLYPTLENYIALTKCLYKKENYKELIQVYELITYPKYINESKNEYLFGKPSEEVLYEYMIASILSENSYMASEIIYQVHEFGYDASLFKEKLIAEARIKMDRKSDDFKEILLQFLSYEELAKYTRGKDVFEEFITSIPDTNSSFSVDAKMIQEFNYRYRGDGGEEMLGLSAVYVYYTKEKQIDSNAWVNYNILRAFKLFPKVTVVEYSVDTSELACPKDMRHIYHRIVTYNDNVEIIDSKVIAYQSGEKLATVDFNTNSFKMIEYKRSFRKPYVKSDFDNDLLKTEKTSEATYQITKEGKIEIVSN
jgi:hypothetical protein